MQYEVAGGECRVVAGPAVVTREAVCSEACSRHHQHTVTPHTATPAPTQGPGGRGQVELLDPGKVATESGPRLRGLSG